MMHSRTCALPAAGWLLLGLLVPGLSAATFQPRGPSLAVGVNGAYLLAGASDHDNALGGGASLLIALTRNFALEVSGQYSRRSTLGDVDAPDASLSPGSLLRIPIVLLVQFRLPIGSFPLVPYLTGGGGYSFNSFSLDQDMISAYRDLGFEISERISGSLMWCVGGGVDIIAASSLIINIHGLYRSSSASGDWSITEDLTGASLGGDLEGLNLGDLSLGLGLKFVF